jgi:putative aldouronate transport system permease protein
MARSSEARPAAHASTVASIPARKPSVIGLLWKYRYLYAMMVPGLLWYLIFAYIPMVGIIVAFKNYYPYVGILKSPWVGFEQFTAFFQSYDFWSLIRNTLVINVLKLVFGFPVPLLFALLLNEVGFPLFKRVVQTVSYFPYFLSWAVVAGILSTFLSPDGGWVNALLADAAVKPIDFMNSPAWLYPLLVISEIWKGYGWGAILYLAAIAGIDPQLYEAAIVDGAGRFRRAWNITLPMIMPTIMVLLILSVGGIFNAAFMYDIGEVIDTFVYHTGIQNGLYSYAAAVGLFKGLIGLVLIYGVNRLAKAMGQQGLW